MSKLVLKSNFGLIGEDLELKKNISIIIDEKGKIRDILYEEIKDLTNIIDNTNPTLLIPGLINSHVHIGDSFAKELGFNKSLIEVVSPPNGIKHRLLKSKSREIIGLGIKNAVSEMISCGTTLFIDYRESGLAGMKILNDYLEGMSIRKIILGRPVNMFDLESVYQEADGLGFASYDQISREMKDYLKIVKTSEPVKIISCHDAELEKIDELFENILRDGLIDVIIHGTHYDEQNLDLLKLRGISLVLCPRSNGYFGVGFPPINEIIKIQIPISIGTDNVMVNNLDLFEELRYLYRIYRVLEKEKQNQLLTSKELLKMITINAARNFKIEKWYGSISKGKFADFFEVNLATSNFYSEFIDKEHIHDLLVQRIKPNNIKKVYIGGNNVYETV